MLGLLLSLLYGVVVVVVDIGVRDVVGVSVSVGVVVVGACVVVVVGGV